MITQLLKTSIGRLRIIAFLEGVSFLILVFIAMPLKYFAGMPWAVKQVGMAHGVLFVLFILALLLVMIEHKWSIWKGILGFLSSLVPFGTFVLDAKFLREEQK